MNKILIVDDEEGMRFVLSSILKKGNYEVITAEDGKHALEKLKEHTPDMAFLDLQLPDMDGSEVLREIKKVRADIPVVMCSGFGDVDFAVRSMKNGAFDYVAKPFKNEDVLNMAKKALASTTSTSTEETKQKEVKTEPSTIEVKISKKILIIAGALLLIGIIVAIILLK